MFKTVVNTQTATALPVESTASAGNVAVPNPERVVDALQLPEMGFVAATTAPPSSHKATALPLAETPSLSELAPEPDSVAGVLQLPLRGSELDLTSPFSIHAAMTVPFCAIPTLGSDAFTPAVDITVGVCQVIGSAESAGKKVYKTTNQLKKNR
jgi:hypothetical protein